MTSCMLTSVSGMCLQVLQMASNCNPDALDVLPTALDPNANPVSYEYVSDTACEAGLVEMLSELIRKGGIRGGSAELEGARLDVARLMCEQRACMICLLSRKLAAASNEQQA